MKAKTKDDCVFTDANCREMSTKCKDSSSFADCPRELAVVAIAPVVPRSTSALSGRE